jgi:hypothetical protein
MMLQYMYTCKFCHRARCSFQELIYSTEPTSQDAKPRVQPGVYPLFYITNVG